MDKFWMWLSANIVLVLVVLGCIAIVAVCIVIATRRKGKIMSSDKKESLTHEFVPVKVDDSNVKAMKDVKNMVDVNDINDTLSRL